MKARLSPSDKQYLKYDKIVANAIGFSMQLFPNKKIIIKNIDLTNKAHLYWVKILDLLQTYGGKFYFNGNIFEYFKFCKFFKNTKIKYTFKKGKSIEELNKKFIINYSSELSFTEEDLKNIYDEYYKLGE